MLARSIAGGSRRSLRGQYETVRLSGVWLRKASWSDLAPRAFRRLRASEPQWPRDPGRWTGAGDVAAGDLTAGSRPITTAQQVRADLISRSRRHPGRRRDRAYDRRRGNWLARTPGTETYVYVHVCVRTCTYIYVAGLVRPERRTSPPGRRRRPASASCAVVGVSSPPLTAAASWPERGSAARQGRGQRKPGASACDSRVTRGGPAASAWPCAAPAGQRLGVISGFRTRPTA